MCAAPALDHAGQQREREAHRREVVHRHHALDVGGRQRRRPPPLRARRRCSPARRRRRARRRTLRANASIASRSERSVTHIRESGACSRQRASTSARRSSRRAQMPTVAPRSRERQRGRRADARRRAGDEDRGHADDAGAVCLPHARAGRPSSRPLHGPVNEARFASLGDRAPQRARASRRRSPPRRAGELAEVARPLLHADGLVASPVHDRRRHARGVEQAPRSAR